MSITHFECFRFARPFCTMRVGFLFDSILVIFDSILVAVVVKFHGAFHIHTHKYASLQIITPLDTDDQFYIHCLLLNVYEIQFSFWIYATQWWHILYDVPITKSLWFVSQWNICNGRNSMKFIWTFILQIQFRLVFKSNWNPCKSSNNTLKWFNVPKNI